MLNEPKPTVVGIAWVVECVEKRAKVDEEKFKVDVDMINVAGTNHKVIPLPLLPNARFNDDYILAPPVYVSETLDSRLAWSRL